MQRSLANCLEYRIKLAPVFLMQQSQAVSENIVYLTGAADYPNFKGYIMVWVLSACFGSFLEFPYSRQMIFS